MRALLAGLLVLTACSSGGAKSPDEPLPSIATADCPTGAELLSEPASSGRRLPDVVLPCLGSDRTVSLRLLGGARPVVVNLWASWCQPCRKEMPAFQAVYRDLRDRVAFLGVNTRDVERPARAAVQATGISYASVVDRDEKVRRELDAVGLPDTVIVDTKGRIVYVHVGELTEQELRDAIREHLGIS